MFGHLRCSALRVVVVAVNFLEKLALEADVPKDPGQELQLDHPVRAALRLCCSLIALFGACCRSPSSGRTDQHASQA